MLRCERSCISFDSYIKPQRLYFPSAGSRVVYLLIPTSNHNLLHLLFVLLKLYIFWFLHQTTTYSSFLCIWTTLYIFWFLHQTTTFGEIVHYKGGCISFDSYIKPQRVNTSQDSNQVVYLLIPTSNHNFRQSTEPSIHVVYLLIPTSNHNFRLAHTDKWKLYIFWFLHQTTTYGIKGNGDRKLYIFWFLHQTTTVDGDNKNGESLYIFWFLHQTTTC